MVQDKKIPTIDLRVPAAWEELTDNQLRYLFGLIALDLSLVEVRTHCLLHWSGLKVLYKYGTGWWCKFVDDEFLITAEQVNAQQGELSSILGRLMAIGEAYPELKANDLFINAQSGITEYEEKVRMSRMVYNDTATKMNRMVRQWPSSFVASMLNFREKEYLTVDEEKKSSYPNLDEAFN